MHWLVVAALSALALWLRVGPRYANVFGLPGFVNFTEVDAWWHVRVIENMAHNFPGRLTVDSFGIIEGQSVNTGPFFDLLPAFLGWLLNLSPHALHVLLAWYPALLGMLLVPVTFLCGRAILNPTAGLWAAAAVATVPGHFLRTGTLGFTDHHVMEALLTSVLLYLLVSKSSPILLGLALTAYLLTFPGGAFVVALVTLWYWVESLRDPETDSRPFAIACLIATPFVFLYQRLYLMNYSLAAVALAATGLWLLPPFSKWCHRQRYPHAIYLASSALTIGVALTLVQVASSGDESLFHVVMRMTASNRTAATVTELQSLTGAKGFFSLEHPWQELGGALVFSLIALPLLAETVWRRPRPELSLLLIWASTFLVMAATQVRMTYYFGVSAALLSGYLMSQLQQKSVAVVVLGAFLMIPNLNRAMGADSLPGQVPADWIAALQFLKDQTPAPFAERDAFTRIAAGKASYSVLAWWDYGYWISTIAHRVPVTNPTQNNAATAADFLLATDEPAAQAALATARAKYVVLDSRLLMTSDGIKVRGIFLNVFPYSRRYAAGDYIHEVQDEGGRRIFFRAKYFETMLARLYLANGRTVRAFQEGNFAVVKLKGGRLVEARQFTNLDEATRAAAGCAECELVSENPATPCVDMAGVSLADPVYASPTTALSFAGLPRSMVQVFAVR